MQDRIGDGDDNNLSKSSLHAPVGSFLRSGFTLALILRLLTSALVVVLPLFVSVVFRVGAAEIGVFVVAIWVGNAAGVTVAVLALRRQETSSLIGFSILALAMAVMSSVASEQAVLALVLVAGVGMGMVQPFLSALMHLDTAPREPFRGVGLYAVALGLGVVLGPLMAAALLLSSGFGSVLFALSLCSSAGVVVVLVRMARPRAAAGTEARTHPFSPSHLVRAFGQRGFSRAFVVNLLYSFLLPVFLSFGAVYAESRFDVTSSVALLLFSCVFAVSVILRTAAVRFGGSLERPLFLSLGFLVLSMLILGSAPSLPFFVAGMLLFSLPHALVMPITNFQALSSVDQELVMNASYAFQASSGIAEFASPAVAVVITSALSLSALFLVLSPVAVVALVISGLPLVQRRVQSR